METRRIILKNYPSASPIDTDVVLTTASLPSCMEGEIVVRLLYLSVDPYMRNRLRPEGTGYISALSLGQPIISMGIAEVVTSKAVTFKTGDKIIGMLPWQDFAVLKADDVSAIRQTALPITTQLGILGYPGLTAYVGIRHLVKLQAGQTVFISAAAGAVGSLVAQLAKLQGCYVVGSTGSDEKVDYLLNELHVDAAFNYRQHQHDYTTALHQYCPRGIDIHFENVGGTILEAGIECINPYGTVILCGAISQYNSEVPRQGPRNLNKLIAKQAKFIHYIVTDYDHLLPEFQHEMIVLSEQNKLYYRETRVHGLEHAWSAFARLFHGKNIGKLLVAL